MRRHKLSIKLLLMLSRDSHRRLLINAHLFKRAFSHVLSANVSWIELLESST